MLLSDRVAIITGGARGIGKGICLKFADEGCACIVADVREEEGMTTCREITDRGQQGIFVKCDVSNRAQVEAMVDQVVGRFGRIDVLVNNAGVVAPTKSIVDVTDDEWEKVISVNLKGVFYCCRAVVPFMKQEGRGKIINLSSMSAICPSAPVIHYSASKGGILGMTLDLAGELAQFNICVNALIPGAVTTEMWDQLAPGVGHSEEFFRKIGERTCPMKRMGTPEDIAGAALFLASSLSDFVTGDRILVGGGYPLPVQKAPKA